MIDISKAIYSLAPTSEWVIRDGVIEWINPKTPPVTEEQLRIELARLQAEYDAKQYQRDRAKEYPSFADQFDTLYHGGYDAWKAQIEAIKARYPKP